jgi:dTDP-4-dehydrorhamnose 3,5-epimerase
VTAMDAEELLPGAWLFTPVQHPDDRGVFLEWYKAGALESVTGRRFELAQANHSVSSRGVVRGVHFAEVPPGQAKWVYCAQGSLIDVVVDLRVGSPTFGRSASARLDDIDRRAVFVSEGLGHGFVVESERASLVYLVNWPYDPRREHTVDPFDAELAIDWRVDSPVLSPRDAAAPPLAEVRDAGLLPTWDACQDRYAGAAVAALRADT